MLRDPGLIFPSEEIGVFADRHFACERRCLYAEIDS
jgi:hypothetical protein